MEELNCVNVRAFIGKQMGEEMQRNWKQITRPEIRNNSLIKTNTGSCFRLSRRTLSTKKTLDQQTHFCRFVDSSLLLRHCCTKHSSLFRPLCVLHFKPVTDCVREFHMKWNGEEERWSKKKKKNDNDNYEKRKRNRTPWRRQFRSRWSVEM